MMTQTTETSVMFALAELQRSEVARQADEAAAQRRQEQEAREQAERERARARAEELQAQRVAEAAARLKVEVEAREAAAQKRVAAMQQALLAVQAERDVLQEHLQSRDPASPAPAVVLPWAMGGMALSLIAVAAMAVVLLTQPVRVRTIPASVARPSLLVGPLPMAALATPPPAPAVVLPRPPVVVPHPKHRPLPPHAPAALPDPVVCGDDPLCGMKFK